MTAGAADEHAHAPPASASWWWETWHLDVATAEGIGLSVRLACAPALGVAWWWTHVLLPDLPGPIVVRDHEVGLPRQGLEIRADGLWGELVCESPLEHWTYGLEAFGVKLDDPADSLHGEIGERMPVGLDLEWEVDAGAPAPQERRAGGQLAGYEQLGVVHGELLLERSRIEIDGVGLRSHTWGAPRFDRPALAYWAHAPELAVSVTDDGAVEGYVTRGAISEAVSSARSETSRRPDGLPVAARHVLDGRLELDADLLGVVAVPIVGDGGERAVLARALCRYEIASATDADPNAIGGPPVDWPVIGEATDRAARGGAGTGRTVIGWSSWLDPE